MSSLSLIENNLLKTSLLDSPLDVSIVFVPQIQLSPYVAAFIRKYSHMIRGDILIIHPQSNPLSRLLLDYGDRCHSLHVKEFMQGGEEIISRIVSLLTLKKKKITALICHSFSDGFNLQLINFFLLNKKNDITYFLYSDGSRNNKEREFPMVRNTSLFDKIVKHTNKVHLIEFGFNNQISDLKFLNASSLFVEYEWLDLVYRTCSFELKENLSHLLPYKLADVKKRAIFILSRYWGREPYFFKSEKDLYCAYVSSIKKAANNRDILIHRGDNRSILNEKIIFELAKEVGFVLTKTLNSLIDAQGIHLNDLLMEVLLLSDINFLKEIEVFYCFDSSFPLIFISKELRAKLSNNVTIIVGFDHNLVKENGVNHCYNAMINRTSKLIFDVLSIELFNVFDSFGGLTLDNLSEEEQINTIKKRLADNGGFFSLKKRKVDHID